MQPSPCNKIQLYPLMHMDVYVQNGPFFLIYPFFLAL